MAKIPDKLLRSRQQEARGASLHVGRRQPGSGNGRIHKGDVRSDEHLIEYKRTDGAQLIIKGDDLERIRKQALLSGRSQLFGFELMGRDYIVVEAADLEAAHIEVCRGLPD